MEFRILGPLEARSGGQPVPVGGPRQRALLAYLLLHANEVVSADRLLDELWYEPPLHGASALQTQISRLRKLVGERLVTSVHGYALNLDADELDLRRLRTLLAAAGDAATPGERSQLLQEAEALWSGQPLAGLDAPFVPGEAAALEELRYGAIEERFAADLERGCVVELLPEISLLVAQQPLRERLRMQQILALYRAGRQADALAAYQEARTILDEQLGLEPSPALKELERAILRQDPALEPSVTPRAEILPAATRNRRRPLVAAFLVALAAIGGTVAALVLAHSPHHGVALAPPPVVVKRHRRRHATVAAVRPHVIPQAPKQRTKPLVVGQVHRSAPPPLPPKRKKKIAKTVTAQTTTATRPLPRRPATISDNFTGSQIDPTIWYQIATGTGWTLTQDNGYVEWAFAADAVPGGQYDQMGGHLGSQCKFPGDFDARVDFSLPVWPAHNGVVVNLWAFFSNVGYAAWRQSSVQWGELFGSYTGPGDSGGVQLGDTSGSLRLARKNGLLTAYFLHNGNWDALTSSRESGLATVAIGANAGGDFAGQPVTVDLSNFSVTGDSPVCPPGSQPTG